MAAHADHGTRAVDERSPRPSGGWPIGPKRTEEEADEELDFTSDFSAGSRHDRGGVVGWVNGWVGITEAGSELALAVHLMLDPFDTAA